MQARVPVEHCGRTLVLAPTPSYPRLCQHRDNLSGARAWTLLLIDNVGPDDTQDAS